MSVWTAVLCSGATHLANRLKKLGLSVCLPFNKHNRFFPNSDIYSRLGKIEDISGKVCVIQSATCSGDLDQEFFTTSDRLFETLQILDVLRGKEKQGETHIAPVEKPAIKKKITNLGVIYTFAPYFLQEKIYKKGECFSAKLALDLTLTKADFVGVIDPHPTKEMHWLHALAREGRYFSISMKDALLKEAEQRFLLKNPLVLSLDKGGQKRFNVHGFGKKRYNSKITLTGNLKVKGRDVILLDDIVRTGTTFLKAQDKLKKNGAKTIIFCAIHSIPTVGVGETPLRNFFLKVKPRFLTTDTVPTLMSIKENPKNTVSCTKLIQKYLEANDYISKITDSSKDIGR